MESAGGMGAAAEDITDAAEGSSSAVISNKKRTRDEQVRELAEDEQGLGLGFRVHGDF